MMKEYGGALKIAVSMNQKLNILVSMRKKQIRILKSNYKQLLLCKLKKNLDTANFIIEFLNRLSYNYYTRLFYIKQR